MPGGGFDMNGAQWLKGLLVHSALAFAVFSLLCAGLERLLPGFVTPFLNIPVLLLSATGLTLLSAVVSRGANVRSIRMWSVVFSVFGLLVAGFFLWTRIVDLGTSGLLLFGAAILASGLLLWALAVPEAT